MYARSSGILPYDEVAFDGASAGPFGVFPGANIPFQPPVGGFAAIGRDAPVVNAPITLRNPFSRSTYDTLEMRYIWDNLMFDPRPLRPVILKTYDDPSGLFDPRPTNPPEGVPMLPPAFR